MGRPIILTFYQTLRFNMVSDLQTHALCKKIMFMILYCIGVLIGLLALALLYVYDFIYDEQLLCHYALTEVTMKIFTLCVFMMYLSWDWTVLYLLYCKVLQFRAAQNRNNKDDENVAIKRLLSIFSKIFLLTIISEILLSMNWFHAATFNSIVLQSIGDILQSVDLLLSPLVIYLMNEHNKDDFIVFVKCLDKFKIGCCCKTLIEESRIYYRDEEEMTKNEIEFVSNQNEPQPDTTTLSVEIKPIPRYLSADSM